MTTQPRLVLASASKIRARVLNGAGLAFEIDPAMIDEGLIKNSLCADNASPREIASVLAETKATVVSRRHPSAWVIGADQVLVLDDAILDKPADPREAASQLRRFRGRSHELISALCVAYGHGPVWRHTESVTLHVRDFSEQFLSAYLSNAGEGILASVGAYRLEGLGVQLFSQIDGDYFAVLGMPLLPLLTFLRDRGVIVA